MVKLVPLALAFTFLLLAASPAHAFFGSKLSSSTKTPKLPLPTFDKETQKWIKSPNDDGKYPYDAVGAALRHGPSPFIARITNAGEYEQGVLKYMASAKVSRAEATGNMDAKLNNAMDWQYQKMAEAKGNPKVDYTRLDKKQAVLTVVWALGITPLALSVISETVDAFINSPGPSVIKTM
mmetsp:Transcript_15646/g.18181  ORF Transcript_15646/g.18181 Transcript_15646/m.18181 type:complete len:180 (+) Transcript_15646:78-617(+)